MLFKGMSLHSFLLPIFIPLVVIVCILSWRIRKSQMSPAEKSFKNFMVMGIAFGVVVAVLWFALPITPTLSTFDRPREINSFNEVLEYLQTYNDALVRTTEVIHAFLFLFLFWFLTACLEFFRAIAARRDDVSPSPD